ncbi:MAG: AAA family ATPase [Gammaproteobacteria bacterium]|nr:AAA family ATPase [Gammaproteobacteria bacterium]MXX95522.1 AAA family ATPase [Gammaproteobacteria bacterium]MYF53919.1 AAA family ATPase [Gammaproteobacteria bacterium]MYK44351.1 AAA family ATPase [Gammaproteobacteria bacterium]
MTFWLEVPEARNLSQAQQEIVALSAEQNLIVIGPPGSGKTITLMYRAYTLRNQYRVDPSRFLIFVYNNVLSDYVQQLVNHLDLPIRNIPTFDSWCRKYHKVNLSTFLPEGLDGVPDFAAIRKEVWEHVEANATDKIYDFIIVDEGQDLDENAFKIMDRLSHHVSVFGDDNQQLYQNGTGFNKIHKILSSNSPPLVRFFPEGFRCTDFIVQLAAEFVETDQKLAFLQQHPDFVGDRQQPELYAARNRADEMRKLIENVQVRLEKSERIAILLPSSTFAPELSEVLTQEGIEFEVTQNIQRKTDMFFSNTIDFDSPRVKIMAYPSIKGITLDSVLMPYLERENFRSTFSLDLIQKWIYVGISRTTNWAYFSGLSGSIMFHDKFETLSNQGYLQFNKYSTWSDSQKTKSSQSVQEEEDLTDLF